MIEVGNIVRFVVDNTSCYAAQWCMKRDLCGKIVSLRFRLVEIEVGLPYTIFVRPRCLKVVSNDGELQSLPTRLVMTAPIPEDGY